MPSFELAGRLVGDGCEPLVIAEIGINHGGSIEVALQMAESAINAGAEVIKHQTHIASDEMSFEAKSIKPGNSDLPIYNIIEACQLNEVEEFQLRDFVHSKGRIFISTPFSRMAVQRIHKMNLPAVKIGSGECNNLPLIKLIVQLKKPIILSTGMNSIEAIRPAVDIIRAAGIPFALMHCTNLYPAPDYLIRLDGILELKKFFPDAVLGLSDHSLTNYPAIASIALGAQIIERHFTDSRERSGPDIPCSMTPSELSELITATKIVSHAKGGNKDDIEEEQVTRNFAFASVVATRDISPGELLSPDNIWVKRPSGGAFPADQLEKLYGKVAATFIQNDTQLFKENVI